MTVLHERKAFDQHSLNIILVASETVTTLEIEGLPRFRYSTKDEQNHKFT